jgi:hypothetical protein
MSLSFENSVLPLQNKRQKKCGMGTSDGEEGKCQEEATSNHGIVPPFKR